MEFIIMMNIHMNIHDGIRILYIKCFDWEIPREWNISDAYVLDPNGNKIVDFKKSNLHVVNYSVPVVPELIQVVT